MCERAPAVEQPGDRVREQRAARDRTGHDLGLCHDVGGQHVEQILRQAPDGRRMRNSWCGLR